MWPIQVQATDGHLNSHRSTKRSYGTASVIFAILAIFFLPMLSVAQTAVVSTGFEMHSINGSASVSVGQVDYLFLSSNGGYVSEGVQQPVEWLSTYYGGPVLSGLDVSIFPNPTMNQVTIDLGKPGSYHLQTFSSSGQLVMAATYENTQLVQLDFSQLPTGLYLVELQGSLSPTISSVFRIIRL